MLAELDYSRGGLADLDEKSLDESAGVCEDVAIDWNVDGTIGVVKYNMNPQEASQHENCGGTYTTLRDHDDWTNLVYLGPSSPGLLFRTRVLE